MGRADGRSTPVVEHQLPRHHGVHSLEVFWFGRGASVPLDEGVYFGAARVVTPMAAGADTQTAEPVL